MNASTFAVNKTKEEPPLPSDDGKDNADDEEDASGDVTVIISTMVLIMISTPTATATSTTTVTPAEIAPARTPPGGGSGDVIAGAIAVVQKPKSLKDV